MFASKETTERNTSTPKDLKLLFAVFHVKPHDDVVDT